MTRRPRFSCAAALGAALFLACTGTAVAGTQSVPNSCQYSYDGYWRDMPVTLTGTPSVSTAAAGETVRLSGQVVDVTLPDWLAEYGYNLGLLHAGENQLPTEVWVAVRGTNTVEGVQWQRVETIAKTTIHVTSTGSFQDATPFTYDAPHLSDTDWTARGGPIAFSQARAGALPVLPVGPGGANRTPKGSVYLLTDLGGVSLGMDCAPGQFIADGSNFTEKLAPPFATVDVPAFQCVNPLTPQGTSTVPVSVELLADPSDPPTVQPGGTLTTQPRVRYRIPVAYLQALVAAGRLQPGDTELTGVLSVALRMQGGTPATQIATAPLDGEIRIEVSAGGTVESPDIVGTTVLTPTTWTASGTAGLQLAAGPAGSLGAVALGGGTTATAYGSVYARLTLTPETSPATRLSLDCVSGEAAIAQAGLAYGERGNVPPASGGDQGRYAIDANQLDAFAVIPVEGVAVTQPPPAPGPAPSPGPAPAVPAASAPAGQGQTPAPVLIRPVIAIGSSSLRAASGKVKVALRCTGGGTCRGRVRLRTSGKVRLSKRARARQVTLTQARTYSVASGRTATVALPLSRDGAALLRRSSRVAAQVVAVPAQGATVERRLSVRRG